MRGLVQVVRRITLALKRERSSWPAVFSDAYFVANLKLYARERLIPYRTFPIIREIVKISELFCNSLAVFSDTKLHKEFTKNVETAVNFWLQSQGLTESDLEQFAIRLLHHVWFGTQPFEDSGRVEIMRFEHLVDRDAWPNIL